jgi:hypothetical protein
MLKRHGLSISPAGVRCVWQRHDLTSMKHRLKALETKVAQDGILLTAAQIAALEKATFYVGTLKGVGRVYQQTFIDTYAKVGFAKLYDRKTPSRQPRSSMIGWCRFMTSTASGCHAC